MESKDFSRMKFRKGTLTGQQVPRQIVDCANLFGSTFYSLEQEKNNENYCASHDMSCITIGYAITTC